MKTAKQLPALKIYTGESESEPKTARMRKPTTSTESVCVVRFNRATLFKFDTDSKKRNRAYRPDDTRLDGLPRANTLAEFGELYGTGKRFVAPVTLLVDGYGLDAEDFTPTAYTFGKMKGVPGLVRMKLSHS